LDTPPHAAPGAAAAAALADLVLVPVRPSAFDIAASAASAEIARTAKQAAFVLSACPSRAPEIMEARKALEKQGLPVLDTEIGERRSYARAVASGRAVAEFEPEGRAAYEISRLWREIKKVIA
jgi:chromosome partitioning protein